MRNLFHFFAVSVVAAGVAMAGCGSDDDSSGSGGSSGSAGSGGSAGSSTGGNGGSSGSSTGGTSGGGGTAGTAGAAGGGGAAGAAGGGGAAGAAGGTGDPAQAFCTEYETVCTFGGADRYTDMADCIAKYNGYDAARQSCVEEHLANAKKGNPTLHCPHATGQAPCN